MADDQNTPAPTPDPFSNADGTPNFDIVPPAPPEITPEQKAVFDQAISRRLATLHELYEPILQENISLKAEITSLTAQLASARGVST